MRVLCVEDEGLVALSLCETLADLGHDAHEVPDAAEALNALTQFGPFEVMLTDIGLPGKDGVALAKEARSLQPDLAIVFSTGYSEGERFEEAATIGPVLGKPYTVAELREALAAVSQTR